MKKLILLFMFLYCMPIINAIPLIDFDFTIYDDNTVILESFNTYDGTYERPLFGNPDYVMELKDKDDNIVEQIELPVIFYHPDIGVINQVSILVKLPYNPDWKSMQIYHSGNLIFQKDIENYFCNDNKLCEENENYVSCEKDCPSGSKDGWCDGLKDDICDSDCLEGIDPDCGQVKEFLKKNVLWLGILIVAIITIILLIKRPKKEEIERLKNLIKDCLSKGYRQIRNKLIGLKYPDKTLLKNGEKKKLKKSDLEWLKEYKEKIEKKEKSESYAKLLGYTFTSLVIAISMFWTIRQLEGVEEIAGFSIMEQMMLWFNVAFWISVVVFIGMTIALISKKYKIYQMIRAKLKEKASKQIKKNVS